MAKTGAKTEAGKAVSKLNALKTGYYAKELLPWEDSKEMEHQLKQLHEQWAGPDPTSQELVNQLHSIQLRIRRLERLEFEYVTTRIFGNEARIEFCKQAGIETERASDLPDWFFDESQPGREEAQRLMQVHKELEQLEFHDSEMNSQKKLKRYPNAAQEMIRTRGETRIALERRLRKLALEEGGGTTPDMFLRCFEEEYVFELFWAKSPDRCDALVRGLRAQIALYAQSEAPWSRQLPSLLKQQATLLSMLSSMKQARTMEIIS